MMFYLQNKKLIFKLKTIQQALLKWNLKRITVNAVEFGIIFKDFRQNAANIYLFKVKTRNTRNRIEMISF